MTWEPSLGAVVLAGGGARFRVWAPGHEAVVLMFEPPSGPGTEVEMQRDAEYWEATVAHARPGDRYRYRLDGAGPFPDPCSRSQPEGVHVPSEVVDAGHVAWTDANFGRPPVEDLVIYECHIGTFTTEGTFEAAIARLPHLVDLGVTVVEMMPVASFPGARNWGYDGVALFAPSAAYGGPEGLRRFVNAAHGFGLAVLLDVVYNHLGPEGNYTGAFSTRYVTERHHTPWGAAVNFDDAGSGEVRRFVTENLLHWVHEYHIDGFRLDATHATIDTSPRHILAEVRSVLDQHPRSGVAPYLIAETHENDVRYLECVEDGGFGFDAVWADDFHNVSRNILHEEREGYLSSFEGTVEELARTISQGFLYEGQLDPHLGEPRGTAARRQPWRQFLYCLQNHDQVGNRAFGERLTTTAREDDVLAATLLLLLLPQTPMLFQGQEFLASTPFLYFTDHSEELGRLVTEGRRQEFAAFSAFRDATTRERIPDPQAESTFLASKLQWEEAETARGRAAIAYHRELLRLRKTDAVLRQARAGRPPIAVETAGQALFARIASPAGERGIALNVGDASASFASEARIIVLHSNDERFGRGGPAPALTAGRLEVPGHSAVFLSW